MPLITGSFEDIGDVLTVQLSPMSLVTGFTGFVETVTGETIPTKEFRRMFRYSSDGGYTFSAWTTLTNPNLAAIVADPLALYYFEIRYERIGTDGSGTMTWTFFNLTATVNLSTVTTYFPVIFTQPNVFGNFEVNDETLQELCGNLLDKIKGYGIIPEYIDRSEAYIHFWQTTCCFFALHFLIADRLSNIYTDKPLLRDYLIQRGVFLCGTESLVELQGIAANYNEKMRYRGTQLVIPELQRLICNCDCCEFIFAYVGKYEAGWVIDNASPMFRSGVRSIKALNKFPEEEWGDEVVDLNNYSLVGTGTIIISDNDNEGNPKDVMRIKKSSGVTGVGYNGVPDPDKMMSVKLDYNPDPLHSDPSWFMNYEIGCTLKQVGTLDAIVSFGVDCFDCDFNLLPNATYGAQSGLPTSWFFRTQAMKQGVKYEDLSGILYGTNAPSAGVHQLINNGMGQNLIADAAVASDIKYVYPKILMENGTGLLRTIYFYNMRVGLSSMPYSLAFMEVANHISGFFSNNNGQLSNAEVERRIKRYLIPINAQLNIVTLS